MATATYGEQLSKNVIQTDDGYLICKLAVIARTGFQRYSFEELHRSHVEKMRSWGMDPKPGETFDLWRDPSEVFAPTTIQSFDGKPLTDEHPEDLVDCETHRERTVGHIQGVAKGPEPLDNGDWPLVCELHITDVEAIRLYLGGRRELSCGYTYDIRRDGNRILMVDIIGNHVALVPRGRAGRDVRIYDAAPEAKQERFNMANTLKAFLGAKFQEWSQTAKPEDIGDHLLSGSGQPAVGFDAFRTSGNVALVPSANGHVVGCRCSECLPTGLDAKAAKDAAAAADAAKAAADKAAKDAEEEKKKKDADDAKAKDEAEAAAAEDAIKAAMDDDDEDDDDDDEDKKGEDNDLVPPIEKIKDADLPDEAFASDAAMVRDLFAPVCRLAQDPKLTVAFDKARLMKDPIKMLDALRPLVFRSDNAQVRGTYETCRKFINKQARGNDAYSKIAVAAASHGKKSAFDSASKSTDLFGENANRMATEAYKAAQTAQSATK